MLNIKRVVLGSRPGKPMLMILLSLHIINNNIQCTNQAGCNRGASVQVYWFSLYDQENMVIRFQGIFV